MPAGLEEALSDPAVLQAIRGKDFGIEDVGQFIKAETDSDKRPTLRQVSKVGSNYARVSDVIWESKNAQHTAGESSLQFAPGKTDQPGWEATVQPTVGRGRNVGIEAVNTVEVRMKKELIGQMGATLHNIRTLKGSKTATNFLRQTTQRPSIIHQGDIFNNRKQMLEVNRQAGIDQHSVPVQVWEDGLRDADDGYFGKASEKNTLELKM